MSRGVNKVILIGNIGRDPELRYLQNGNAVSNVGLATQESWKDKNSGDKQEKTEWHNLVFYGKLAEILNEYCKKGSKIYVEGKLQTRKWQEKETGADRYSTEIIVREMQMLSYPKDGDEGVQGEEYDNAEPSADTPAPTSKPQGANSPAQAKPAAKKPAKFDNTNFDDDIPF